ncbi:histone-fold-containing protein, partial [Dipodascopsis tothii]|uniref:histone-fold-containing protein n=1 Tax=Dipodascopsis tothii TaxID=44089 RepID=UPI0034CE2842
DYVLPRATVARLAKGTLPGSTQIQRDAIMALTKGATVFVNYLTSTANDVTLQSGRKTVSPADVFKAIEILDLGFFLPELKAEVDSRWPVERADAVYLELTTTKRKPSEAAAAASPQAEAAAEGEQPAKKIRGGKGERIPTVGRRAGALTQTGGDDDETEVEDIDEDEDDNDHDNDETENEDEDEDEPAAEVDAVDVDDKPVKAKPFLSKDVDVSSGDDNSDDE